MDIVHAFVSDRIQKNWIIYWPKSVLSAWAEFKYGTMKQFNPPRAARRREHHFLKASSISFFMKGEGQGSIKRSVQIFVIISSYFLQQIVHLKGTQYKQWFFSSNVVDTVAISWHFKLFNRQMRDDATLAIFTTMLCLEDKLRWHGVGKLRYISRNEFQT